MAVSWAVPAIGLMGIHPAALHAETIENPSDEQIISLYHYLAGDPPNFEQDARRSSEYYSANEFDKPAVLKQVMAKMRALYEGNANIDLILLRTNSRFGEYNADLGGYQFDIFEPGVYFPFGSARRYGLTMENAADFRNWIMPVSEAKAIRDLAPHGGLTFEIAIRPFAVAETRDRSIRGQIVAVKAFAQRDNRLVHEAALDPSEYRAIAGADSPVDEHALETEKIAIQGVPLGMAKAAFESWLADNGYQVKVGARKILFGTNTESINLHNSGSMLQRTGNTDYDPASASLFGKDFDCRTVDDRLHSCGIARFDEEGLLISLVLMQSAVGVTKQQIVSSLHKAYGSPSDHMNVFVMRAFRGEQFVWGLSSTELENNATNLTDVSGPKHWQVETMISEPSTERIVVFVQINKISAPATGGAVAGGGQIKF